MITNHWNQGKETRYDVSFWLDFSVAHDRARRVLLGAVWAVAGRGPIMDRPEPQVLLAGTSDLGVEYRIRYWIKPWDDASPSAARDVVIRSVLDHLRHAGISLAYPKEDIYFEPMPSRQLNAATIADRELLLRVIPLFQSLTREELQHLAQHMHEHQYPEGTVLFTQGDPGKSMFIVFEGLLKVSMKNGNGEPETVVGQFAPGQWFGEVSLLTGDVREATVRARTESIVYEITKEHLDALFERRPELVEKLATALVDRMVEMSRIADEASRERAAAGSARPPTSTFGRMLARVRGTLRRA
jgi:CRP-like cAMP-binding protein